MREFNITGVCIPEKHYMVDISMQLNQIQNDFVDKGKYFTINRARQYGKTTTLYLLGQRLKSIYTVCSISFEAADDYFTSSKNFVKGIMLDISDELKRAGIPSEIINGWNEKIDTELPMRSLSQRITWLCEQLDNKVVLIIDEVDKNSDNQIFLTFLGMLRDKYLDRNKGVDATFQSVILAGVYDIKNMKLKLRSDEERKYNSPWNVADDFEIDMSFSAMKIQDMLQCYSEESGFDMDDLEMSELISDYTSGYPYLVSRLCRIMDEESKNVGATCWDRQHFNMAVKSMLKKRSTLFDDINKNMNKYSELSDTIKGILLKGRQYSFSLADDTIQLGVMFGYFAELSGEVVIANRIFEMYFYDMFYKAVEQESSIVARSEIEKNEFIDKGHVVYNYFREVNRMAEYYLMNKNRELMLFSVFFDDTMGEYDCKEIERYGEPEEFPPKFSKIKTWINDRNYAKHKEHLQKWLKEWQLDNILGFIDMTHALSLNDSLWVKPADSDLSWERMNLYNNEFTDVVSKTAFERGLQGLKLSTTSPEFTSEGSFEKCWIREEDGIYLYKKSSSGFANAGLESYSEYYSSQFSALLCNAYVDYDLVKFKGSLVSRCKMFTNENEGFVPIYKYLDANETYYINDLVVFLESYGFEEDFRNMIVLDAVILNPDRHLGNFGFIVDNETYKVLRFAPAFDHNMAMLSRAMKDDLTESSPYIENMGHKINGDFIPVARALATDSMKSKLKDMTDIPLRLHEQYNLPKERTDFLEWIVRKQIREIVA